MRRLALLLTVAVMVGCGGADEPRCSGTSCYSLRVWSAVVPPQWIGEGTMRACVFLDGAQFCTGYKPIGNFGGAASRTALYAGVELARVRADEIAQPLSLGMYVQGSDNPVCGSIPSTAPASQPTSTTGAPLAGSWVATCRGVCTPTGIADADLTACGGLDLYTLAVGQ